MNEAEICAILAEAAKDRNNRAAGFLAKHFSLQKSRAVLYHMDFESLKQRIEKEYAMLEDKGDAFTFLMFTGILNANAVVVEAAQNGNEIELHGYSKDLSSEKSAADEAVCELLKKFGA